MTSVLSTFPLMRVVSARDLPPQSLANPKQAAQELRANYTLGADLANTGEKVRIRAQLTDAASGETVWSNAYAFQGGDPIAIQERTAEKIYGEIGGISGKVRKAEDAAAWRKQESALTDYDYYLRSVTYYVRYTNDDNLRARKIAEDGLARFPDSPLLKNRLAWTYIAESEAAYGPFENCRETIDIAYKLGRAAEDANNKSRFLIYQNLKLMAHVYAWHGEFDRSVQQAEAAVAMSPYDAELRSLALFLANAGNFDEAIEWSLWASAHDQQKNSWLKGTLAWAYYLAGRAEEALETVKGSESFWGDLNVAVYARLGRIDEAKARGELAQDRTPFDPDAILHTDPRADEASVSRRPAQGRRTGEIASCPRSPSCRRSGWRLMPRNAVVPAASFLGALFANG